jgi:hypothetical protein
MAINEGLSGCRTAGAGLSDNKEQGTGNKLQTENKDQRQNF